MNLFRCVGRPASARCLPPSPADRPAGPFDAAATDEPPAPATTVHQAALRRVELAVRDMAVANGFQALVNLLHHDADLVLPESLMAFVDDPGQYPLEGQQQKFADVHGLLPKLVDHYAQEAQARDLLRAARRLQLTPGTPLFERVQALVTGLYSETDPQRYESLIRDWQTLALQQRLKHAYLQHQPPQAVHEMEQVVAQAVQVQRADFADPALQPGGCALFSRLHAWLWKQGIAVPDSDKRLWQMCHSFIVTQSLHEAGRIRERLAGNIVDLLHHDFAREIVALDDLPSTVLDGRVRLFRGLRRIDASAGDLQQRFNDTHRVRSEASTKGRELLTFKISTDWNVRNAFGWAEGTAVFTSFDPDRAFSWGDRLRGLSLEFMPRAGWVHLGKAIEYEVLVDQLGPEDLVAAYELDYYSTGVVVKAVHENPNFRGFAKGLAGASFAVGTHKLPEVPPAYAATKKQLAVSTLGHPDPDSRYADSRAFASAYDRQAVRRRRAALIEQRGYTSHQDKLRRFPPTFAALYSEVRQCIRQGQPVPRRLMARLARRVDKLGNSPLGRAIAERDLPMFDHCRAQGLSLLHVNFNGQSLLHLAAAHDSPLIDVLIDAGVPVEARDIEGYTPLAEACNRGHLQALQRLRQRGARFEAVDARVVHQRLRLFAPQLAAAYFYGEAGIPWAALPPDRLLAITAEACVEAWRRGHVTRQELLELELRALDVFLQRLRQCVDIHEVLRERPEQTASVFHAEQRTSIFESVQPPMALASFPFDNRMSLLAVLVDWREIRTRAVHADAASARGMPRALFLAQALALKDCDPEAFALLVSPRVLNLHRFGIVPTDLQMLSKAQIGQLLTSENPRADLRRLL